MPPFSSKYAAQYVEPVITNLIRIIKRDMAEVFALPDVNKGDALPVFVEVIGVRKNEPHYNYCVVQARTTATDRSNTPISVDEQHLINVFIGVRSANELLADKLMYRYVRGTDQIISSAKKDDIFEGVLTKETRAGLRCDVVAHNYGQVGYDSTNYTFLASLGLDIREMEK